jgi:hypothetical protein
MRNIIVILTLVLGISTGSFAAKLKAGEGEKVYTCDSKTAKAYHKSKTCSGLKSCKGKVTEMDKADAEKAGKTACKMCYKTAKAKAGDAKTDAKQPAK